MAEAACIEVAQAHARQEPESLVRPVALRIYNLLLPLTEMKFPEFAGQKSIDEADALLIDIAKTDGTWMGDGPRPSMQEFLSGVADNLASASLELEAGNPIATAPRCLLREALPLAVDLSNAFRTCQLTGDSSVLVALQDGRQPAAAPEPEPVAVEGKEQRVLEAVALNASILLNLLDSACRSTDPHEVHELAEAARVIGACIGSLADGMAGENSRGDQYGWHSV